MNEIFEGERTCPRDERHDPHDERAYFCWVCGDELTCLACGAPVAEHDPDEPHPLARLPKRLLVELDKS